jgi:hypothetical protein
MALVVGLVSGIVVVIHNASTVGTGRDVILIYSCV